MLAYSDVVALLEPSLAAMGYGTSELAMPYFAPDPADNPVAQDQSPTSMVIINLTPGAGLDSEQVFDQAGLYIRTIGDQNDYDGAEKLAQDCDRALIAIDTSQKINGKHTLSIQRAGGAPALLLQDDGDRYHFTGNYIWEVVY
jgi:hypothetical protein